MKYRLFLDESCHLEHDKYSVMTVGYIKVPDRAYPILYNKVQDIKTRHKARAELKWNKFSKAWIPYYFELIDFFFQQPLEFRCMVVKYKDRLNHDDFNKGSHDNFYYKMIYFLLKPNPINLEYHVFIDIKDTHGKEKLLKINQVFENKNHGNSPFVHFQHIRSHENVFIQLADFFIGAVTYKSRSLKGEFEMEANRKKLINYLEVKSGFRLDVGTPSWETKFNIFD
ncbi:MAG: DUF3800 domain-containing protein, partial [Bacteroidetes bacterium]|nr:DUF3800 domain-containing protein [Bacteroidota bacterium]